MAVLGSFRTFEHLPDKMGEGLIYMVESLMNCFPDAQREYHRLMDLDFTHPGLNPDFVHAAEAYRILAPAVEKVSYPLHCTSSTA